MLRNYICAMMLAVPTAGAITAQTLNTEGAALHGSDCSPVKENTNCSRWSWEVAGRYNHAFTEMKRHSPAPKIDTWGADVTGLYQVRENHFVTCRFSYAYGAEDGFKLHRMVLAPGYRYVWAPDEKWKVYAGADIGIGLSMLDTPGMGHRSYAISRKDDMANLELGLEIGARYAVSPRAWVLSSVGLNAGTAPFHSAAFENATEEQVNLTLRLGIGGRF